MNSLLTLRQQYLDLTKRCILGLLYEDKPTHRFDGSGSTEFSLHTRTLGIDWPSQAHSMIGLKRMDNLQFCVEQVIQDRISGDLIETGVWRGGASIFMRATLFAHEVTDRVVWVADSFEGLPAPDVEKYPQDEGYNFHLNPELAVSLFDVQTNFARYGLLDDQVQFLRGWFRDTLPTAPIESLAILRMDGDLYESTMDALVHLYPKLTIGGYAIVDDYGIKACQEAVTDYRNQYGIEDEIVDIDGSGVYWRRA